MIFTLKCYSLTDSTDTITDEMRYTIDIDLEKISAVTANSKTIKIEGTDFDDINLEFPRGGDWYSDTEVGILKNSTKFFTEYRKL